MDRGNLDIKTHKNMDIKKTHRHRPKHGHKANVMDIKQQYQHKAKHKTKH